MLSRSAMAVATIAGMASAGMALTSAAPTAFARDAASHAPIFCVRCTGPDQTYRCKVTGVDPHLNGAIKLYCVIALTKQGHHTRCTATRATHHCAGPEKTFSYNGSALLNQLASDPRIKKLQKRIKRENEKFATTNKAKNGQPKSLADLTSRMFKASKRGIAHARARLGYGGSEAADTDHPAVKHEPPAPGQPKMTRDVQKPSATEQAGADAGLSAPAKGMESFASRSYHCLISLFRHCGGEPSPAPN